MSLINTIWGNIQRTIPAMNTSNAGILRKIAEVVGTVLDIVRLEILRSEQTIAAAAKIARVTSEAWYVEKAYAYQQGDQVVVVNEATQELGYATIDATKQIIKQASMGSNQEGLYYINVATADANNNVVSLTQDQLDAFSAYYRNFWGVGAQVQSASNPRPCYRPASCTSASTSRTTSTPSSPVSTRGCMTCRCNDARQMFCISTT